MMYKKILIATDGSESNKKAVVHGIEIAKLSGAALHTIYVVGTKGYGCGTESCISTELSPESLTMLLRRQGDGATKYIEKLAKKEGMETQRWVVEGDPAEEILKLAEKQSIDLIVVGTLGMSGIEKFLLGSVADKVIRNSRIPVLTVRK